tara:strand:+ start:425 stop:646 length:222 start_codon:yes stop_codon:yes gene_type:complete
MGGILGGDKPKEVNESVEKAKLDRKRQAQMRLSNFEQNTSLTGGSGVTDTGSTFSSGGGNSGSTVNNRNSLGR